MKTEKSSFLRQPKLFFHEIRKEICLVEAMTRLNIRPKLLFCKVYMMNLNLSCFWKFRVSGKIISDNRKTNHSHPIKPYQFCAINSRLSRYALSKLYQLKHKKRCFTGKTLCKNLNLDISSRKPRIFVFELKSLFDFLKQYRILVFYVNPHGKVLIELMVVFATIAVK